MEQQLKQIGKRIAICRKNLDLSQKDFASKLNISNKQELDAIKKEIETIKTKYFGMNLLKMVNLRQVSCCLWIFVLY